MDSREPRKVWETLNSKNGREEVTAFEEEGHVDKIGQKYCMLLFTVVQPGRCEGAALQRQVALTTPPPSMRGIDWKRQLQDPLAGTCGFIGSESGR